MSVKIITSDIPCLRDPFIVIKDGIYYAYGTGWVYYKNESGSLDGHWEGPFSCVNVPANVDGCQWAPEVHYYKGSYYMITTYHSSVTGHRGCTIMKSDKPEGPFTEISDGQITPHEWDCIDGTLYVDGENNPWLVFVHEWTCTPDKVGRMDCARLSDDLTHLTTEPYEMFRGDTSPWAEWKITDGCWMYTTAEGKLIMLWSNFDKHGYAVGIAESLNGKVDGEWKHCDKPLFNRLTEGTYDGGHGMLFTDTDGQMYLSIHSPNQKEGERRETPIFVAVSERNGTIVCDG